MRTCLGPCVLMWVAACGPDDAMGGTSSGGGSEGGAEGESSPQASGGEGSGAEATGGDESSASSAGDASDGNGDGDGDGDGDDDGAGAHECAAFDPALDEPPCTASGDAEAEPNDQVSQANVVCVDSSYVAEISNDADVDVFEFVVPPAAYGGYVVASLTDVGAQSTVDLEIRAGVDNSIIISDGTVSDGESLYVWFTTAPGETYRAIAAYGWDEPGGYTFLAEWSPAPDCYEPNDTRADSKWIPVGETIEAFLLAGHVASEVADEAFDDWYRVQLSAGDVDVVLRDVPAQAGAQLELFDAQGAVLASEWGFDGEGLTLQTDVPAGEYHVRVGRNFSAATRGMGVDTVPDHFSQRYSLTVSQ